MYKVITKATEYHIDPIIHLCGAFATETTSEREILGLDGNALGVDGSQVGVWR